MIEKLENLDELTYDEFAKAVEDKINELVIAHNKHYHETLDTHYNTTGPKND